MLRTLARVRSGKDDHHQFCGEVKSRRVTSEKAAWPVHPFSPSKDQERSERTTSLNFEAVGDTLRLARGCQSLQGRVRCMPSTDAPKASSILLSEANIRRISPLHATTPTDELLP